MGTLGLTTSTVEKFINPTGERGLFMFGGTVDDPVTGKYPTDLGEARIEAVDRLVVGSLSEEDRRIVSGRIEGEVAVEEAYAGQTKFNLSFHPVSNVVLYVDFGITSIDDENPYTSNGWYKFGDTSRNYLARSRADRLPSSLYSVTDADAGEVTLTFGLAEGQAVFADYRHTGGSLMLELRELALEILAAKLPMRLPAYQNRKDELQKDLETALAELDKYMVEGRGLQTIDNVEFVPEMETRNPHGATAPRRPTIDW